MDAPLSATGNLGNAGSLRRALSYVRPLRCGAFGRGPAWCSRTGSKSLTRARSPASMSGFSGPVCPTLAPALSFAPGAQSGGRPPGHPGPGPEFSPSSVSSFFFPSSRHAALGRQTSFFTESAHTVRAILFARATAATLNGFSSIILRSQGSAISSRPL